MFRIPNTHRPAPVDANISTARTLAEIQIAIQAGSCIVIMQMCLKLFSMQTARVFARHNP